jgi:hypothetical protein
VDDQIGGYADIRDAIAAASVDIDPQRMRATEWFHFLNRVGNRRTLAKEWVSGLFLRRGPRTSISPSLVNFAPCIDTASSTWPFSIPALLDRVGEADEGDSQKRRIAPLENRPFGGLQLALDRRLLTSDG